MFLPLTRNINTLAYRNVFGKNKQYSREIWPLTSEHDGKNNCQKLKVIMHKFYHTNCMYI